MQSDNDANCQLFKYVNVAKCQWLLNVNTKLINDNDNFKWILSIY